MINQNVVSDILPSDHLGVHIRNIFLRKVGTHSNTSLGLLTIDVTKYYNLFVDQIESKFNRLYTQTNTMLFCFIVEYMIINLTHRNLLYYLDGKFKQFDYSIEDIHLEHIEMFIRTNKIPFQTDNTLTQELNNIRASGALEEIIHGVVDLLRPYGLSWDDIATRPETNILPLEWMKLGKDPALEPTGDIRIYREKYKYDIELRLVIGVLTMDDLTVLTPKILEDVILYTLDPIRENINMESMLCNKEI